MIKILITAVGGDIGQGVLKSLRLSSQPVNITGTDSDFRAAGLFLCDSGFLIKPAAVNPKKYVEKILTLCQREAIDVAFINHENEQKILAANMSYLHKKCRTYFVVQPTDVLSITMDKFKTYSFLSRHGINVPDTCVHLGAVYKMIKKTGFPIILKSRSGSGSKHFYIVKDRPAFVALWKKISDPLAQAYVGNKDDEEYTVGVFLDRDSKAIGAIPMLRRLRFGLTWHAIVDNFIDVQKTAILAAESIKAVGPCNVQMRRAEDGRLFVIEINARISSTTIFRAKMGFNEAEACIDYFLYNKKPTLTFRKGVAMKIWDEMIIPLDKYMNFLKQRKTSSSQ